MKVATAELPAQSGNDRIIITDDGVIVLDGATAFDSTITSTSTYVDVLGTEIRNRLHEADSLKSVLAESISATAERLQLRCGTAPSSTVALLRITGETINVLVLGDSYVVVGLSDGGLVPLTDDRLAQLNIPESKEYRRRLASGAGYDETHRNLLRRLQRRERERRNRDNGYWIAEADPTAAEQAVTRRYRRDAISWAVLATDGVSDPLVPLGISWPEVADLGTTGLVDLLAHCHQWEAMQDPDGQQQPRPKRHDDKAVAVVRM